MKTKKLILSGIAMLALMFAGKISAQDSPEWAKNLIICEIATRGLAVLKIEIIK
jgi:hypothetical protein